MLGLRLTSEPQPKGENKIEGADWCPFCPGADDTHGSVDRSEKFFGKSIDNWMGMCYYNDVKRRERGLLPKTSREKTNVKKPLDKPLKV